ncbi:MAG: hypothetical protein KJJ56_07055 [Serratia rubidaea]|nr:hypothetical protein [Serratia rubidaea]
MVALLQHGKEGQRQKEKLIFDKTNRTPPGIQFQYDYITGMVTVLFFMARFCQQQITEFNDYKWGHLRFDTKDGHLFNLLLPAFTSSLTSQTLNTQ